MKPVRDLIRNVLFFLFGLIVLSLAFRLLFDVTGLSANLSWYRDFSDMFVRPFRGVVGSLDFGSRSFDLTVLFAIFSYVMLATLLEQILLTFLYPDFRIIFIEIIVSLFKLAEYLLLYRIVIKLFDMGGSSALKADIYRYSDIFVSPLNFIPSWEIGVLEFDFAAIIVLVIIVIFDLVIETFLTEFLFPAVKYESRRVIYKVRESYNRA